jgi:hypothetical protein
MDRALSGPRPVLLAWAFLAVLTGAPYLRAAFDPPPGTAFLGFFYFADDSYHYLSFVQQAEDGAFLFRNKLVLTEHAAALVNLEWWLVGRLSAMMGRHPLVAYRLFGLAAALAFLAAADLWLRRAGLPASHRLPALLLVGTGGGLGGLLFHVMGRPLPDCVDLTTGLFPFIGLLANPHFVAGTALLLWSLWAFIEARGPVGHLRAVLLGSALGLVRPYDFVLLVALVLATLCATHAAREWPRRLLPLLGLLPVAFYSFWVFYRNPAFAFFTSAPYVFPTTASFLYALLPAIALACPTVALPASREERRFRIPLFVWAALAALVIAARPVHFSLQFLVGVGFPLLGLGALWLSRRAPWITVCVAAAFGTTAWTAMGIVLSPNPRWFPPAERLGVAAALRPACHPGRVVLAPPDIGLYAAGLTACTPFVSHPIAPDYLQRDAAARTFYADSPPSWRAALLERHAIAFLIMPGDQGLVPREWLGEATPFKRFASFGSLSLYARTP